jgi:hypothetical protein
VADASEPRDPRGRFAPGNPGKPHGARVKRTAISHLLPEDAQQRLVSELYRRAIEDADTQAATYLLNRLIPARKGTLLELAGLPPVRDAPSAAEASAHILKLVTAGEVTSDEAKALQDLVAAFISTHDAAAVRADLDRVLEHLGLARDAPPGEIAAALAANGHAAGQH